MAASPEQLFALALQRHQSGRYREAQDLYHQVLAQAPNHGDALHYMGLAAHQQGRAQEAIEWMRRALAAGPQVPHYHANLAQVLALAGRRDEAIAEWRNTIALQPRFAPAHAQLGICLRDSGRMPEAAAALGQAVAIKPDAPEWLNELGNCLLALRRLDDAAAVLQRATRLKPGLTVAWNNLALVLREQARFSDAEAALRHALQLSPSDAVVHSNLAQCVLPQGRIGEGLSELRAAVDLDPSSAEAQSNLLVAMHYDPTASPQDIFPEHLRWAGRHASVKPPDRFANEPDPNRRLRIGYVSHNLHEHSVAYFLEPILANHDPGGFEVACYADVPAPDTGTARLRAIAGVWRSIAGLSPETIAAQIQADQIDILVDLAGHTSGRLLRVFARKPAPIQATYLGYPDTTGMRQMDYRVTDETADPPGLTESLHTEHLLRPARCGWCYRPPDNAPQIAPAPCLAGGFVTFGSFNHLHKLNGKVLETWAEVLLACANSRLVLKAESLADGLTRQRILDHFRALGIEATRIDLLPQTQSRAEHLDQYRRIDVALDPFPYNGTATTCEALWMGAAVITLAGNTHVSRVGASLLGAIGLGDLIATNRQQYVQIAASLAANPQRVAELRAGMRRRLAASPLRDELGFTRALEAAYRTIWRHWCDTAVRGSDTKRNPQS